jgi:hypothetical protein
VAALLAERLTNRQSTEQLVVAERTVAAHIEHILDKLGFASRHQVAAWAADNGLRSRHECEPAVAVDGLPIPVQLWPPPAAYR